MGDPINRMDTSRHLSRRAWLGNGLGVLGIALTVIVGLSMAEAGVVKVVDTAATHEDVFDWPHSPDTAFVAPTANFRAKRAPEFAWNSELFNGASSITATQNLNTQDFSAHMRGDQLPNGITGGHLHGAGYKKSEFPPGWDTGKIKRAAVSVINNYGQTPIGGQKPWWKSGSYYALDGYSNGLKIRVVIKPYQPQRGVMKLVTAFPLNKQ